MRFAKSISVALALSMTACATLPTADADRLQTSDSEPLINRSEVVAVVASVDVATSLEQDAARWGYDLKRKEALSGLGIWMLTFDCPPGIDPEVATRELERLSPRSEVEVNHRFELSTARRVAALPQSPLTQGREFANQLIAWPKDGCEASLRVGMIDGAVDRSALPDGASVTSRSFVGAVGPEAARDHGTAVAQLLVGEGRLRDTDLFAASVVAETADGETYSGVEPMLRALDWMARENVRVVNVSLAGPYNTTLKEGFRRATQRGMIVVAAVGNDGPDARPRYPAAFDNVVAATAVDANMKIYDRAVRGEHVDVSAPGVDVFIPGIDGGTYISGTSVAAPFVSAWLAVASASDNSIDGTSARSALQTMTKDIGDAGRDSIYGQGLIRSDARCR